MSTDTTPISPKRVLVLTACMLATFMAAIEVTIVSTAMPTIIADLGGFSLLGWVFAAYLLTQAISIPIYGRLADLHGRKRMFYIGASLFLLGSVLCGFAHSMLWLIAFRALQGPVPGRLRRSLSPLSPMFMVPLNVPVCRDISPASGAYRRSSGH